MLTRQQLPDVTSETQKALRGKLDWVGMEGITVPLFVRLGKGTEQSVVANARIYVDLADPEAKGIHMSRLFNGLSQGLAQQSLRVGHLQSLLNQLLKTHVGLSEAIRLDLGFELPLLRKALVTDYQGWRSYPVSLSMEKQGDQFFGQMEVGILYSSTCPCSASLARAARRDQFAADFAGKEMLTAAEVEGWLLAEEKQAATAHAQRSEAKVNVALNEQFDDLALENLIDLCEATLGTPVQTAVKREDEQEFARLNARNLMFAEDAARKIASALREHRNGIGFHVEVRHFESLHAHDAVAVVSGP